MKSRETSQSAQVLKTSQPEEFDLVILGGGTGSTSCRLDVCCRGKARRSRRAQIHRRIVPQHRVLAKQEHHP